MKLYYQGHGSYRFISDDGRVVYVDPYVGDGYDLPADIIFVTHQHDDHNRLELITQKPGCILITNKEALEGGRHNSFDLDGITAEAVEANNKNHHPDECVGFILTFANGITVYCSGDTSKTAQMSEFADRKLDYAILCTDGIYNMGLDEAAECAEIIGAKHNIPVHIKPKKLFDRELAKSWIAPNKLILEPGDEITL